MTEETRAQIWAEAMVYVAEGETSYLDAAMELEATKAQQAALMYDEREGDVIDYLETLLPADWEDWDLMQRVDYFQQRDVLDATKQTGTVQRTKVSVMEIFCECFGRAKRYWTRKDGDEIVAIDDARGLEYSGYQQYLKTRAGGEVTLTVKREGDRLLQIAVPVSDQGKLGVIARNPYTLRTQEYTFWQSIPAGIEKAGKVISSYWEQLKMIVQPKTKMYEELGGFIAIGSIFPGDWNWEDFWLKTAFLSIILAVMNILPIPGLDGGHAIFTFWEMVTGRKVSDKVLEGAQYVGLVIILFLLLYANGNDIYRFFIK